MRNPDVTHLDTAENSGDVVVETHLAAQNKTPQSSCPILFKMRKVFFIPPAVERHMSYQTKSAKRFVLKNDRKVEDQC